MNIPPMARVDLFSLYERSVQSPEVHVEWYASMYQDLRGRPARRLREDFCGTFQICCEWVKADPRNTAIGLELDESTLGNGRKKHLAKLSPKQKARVRIYRKNVISVTSPKADVIAANNFSFFVFLDRKTLLSYFKACWQSLASKGIIILEMAGGPGMIEKVREPKKITAGRGKPFTYIWDQKAFDPITRQGDYAIHFKLEDGTRIKDAFTYHWRMWTIPEIREALMDAGFKRTLVYWDVSEDEDDEDYTWAEHGENVHSYVAYIVGLKD